MTRAEPKIKHWRGPRADFVWCRFELRRFIDRLCAIGSCIGVGITGSKFLESSARQPELMDSLRTKGFLLVGVLDGAFIIATGIGLWFATANPFKG